MTKKIRLVKAAAPPDPEVTRLEELEVKFVSLVPKGANRQERWLVVKADGHDVVPVEDAEKASPADGTGVEDKLLQGDPKEQPGSKEAEGQPAPQAGGEGNGTGTATPDFATRLAAAADRVSALRIDAALAAQNAAPAAGTQPPEAKAQVGKEDGEAPAVEEIEAKLATVKRELANALAETVTMKATLKDAEVKMQSQLTAQRAEVSRLKAAIGTTTVIPTGEVTKGASEPNQTEKPKDDPSFWAGDISKRVANEERTK